MNYSSKWILLLALLLNAAILRAEGGDEAVAEPPAFSDVAVIVSDEQGIAEAQRRVVEEANRAGIPVTRGILEGEAFGTLSPEELAPLTTDGESTAAPHHAENLAEKMDANRRDQISRYGKAIRMMAVGRAYAVGGITSITMAVGALQAGANPKTVLASAALGLAVGGPYSYFLQKKNKENLGWQGTQSLFAIDPEKRPANGTVKILKQMAIPVTLATLMNTAKLVADQVPGVELKNFWTDPAMLKGVGTMAVASAWFQYPWTQINQQKMKAENAAAGTDELGLARAKFNSDRRSLAVSLLLSVTNSLQLGGMGGVGTATSFAVGTVGQLYRKVTSPKSAEKTATRGLASNDDGHGQEPVKKGLAAKVGGICRGSYSSLIGAATRTLASTQSR